MQLVFKIILEDLVLQAPVKHPGWSGVLEAISEGDRCMQYLFMTDNIIGSEDCLYLNVLVPQVVKTVCIQYNIIILYHLLNENRKCNIVVTHCYQQNELNGKLAVMMFIHGGAFNYNCGSVNEHSPDYLIDENVIVVMINYRLNVLGDCSKIYN